MPIGPSRRIVVEIDPTRKRALYSKLASEGLTLKDWFRGRVEAYLGPAKKPRTRKRRVSLKPGDEMDGLPIGENDVRVFQLIAKRDGLDLDRIGEISGITIPRVIQSLTLLRLVGLVDEARGEWRIVPGIVAG